MNGKFSRKLLCAAVASACAGGALAGPVGPTVTAGAATFNPATLTVTTASARTAINWQSFVVTRNEVVNFVQPSAQSTVLNQISNSFSIQGSVTSNGSVLFLSNGLVSGSGVNLDVAGMLTSSVRFSQGALSAINAAALSTQIRPSATVANGRVLVISQDMLALSTAGGDVMLNPGKTVELADASSPHLRVQVSAPSGVAINISRLVGKGETSIFAGLFRAPAAARQAVDRNSDGVQTASAELAPNSPGAERFYRYAEAVFARVLSEYTQALNDEAGGLVKVAAVSGSRMALPETRSRASLLPQEIEIGARTEAAPAAQRSETAEPVLAMIPSVPAREVVATIEPQAVAVASKSDLELNSALILASIPPEPVRDVVATLEPQPFAVASKSDLELNSALILASIPATPAPVSATQTPVNAAPAPATLQSAELTLVAGLEIDPGQGRFERPAARGAVVVVAASGQDAASRQPASEAESVTLARAEPRRAPRIMTDFRGAIFHM
jgi:filamentous hemagglutinin family protein